MLKLRTFKGKISVILLISSSVFILLCGILIIVLGSVSSGRIFIKHADLKQALTLAEFKSGFELYKYDINRMISSSQSLKNSDVINNPLRKKLAAKISEIPSLAKTFDEYNKSLPKNYDSEIYKVVSDLQNQIEINKKAESASVEHYFGFAKFLIFLFVLIWFASAIYLYLKTKRLISQITKTSKAIQAMEFADFKPDLISANIPMKGDSEFFELANRLTKVAYLIYYEKQRIYDFAEKSEDENSKHRILSSYANAILNSLDIGILVTDNLNKISYVNSAFQEFWRIPKGSIIEQEILEMPFLNLIKGWKEAIQNPPQSFIGKYKMSGTSPMKEIMFSVLPVYDRTGREKLGTVSITKEA